LFSACHQPHKRLGYLAAGVNAHVNGDLALVLRDQGMPSGFIQDLLRINLIITRQSRNILKACGLSTWADPVLMLGMPVLILWWSVKAWRTYRKLASGRLSDTEVMARAARTGSRLLRLPWPL